MWFYVSILSFTIQCVLVQSVTVTIQQGTVVGSQASDGNYYEFYGIPFADTTSGINRFKAPLPAPSFHDTLIADRKGIKCVRALGVGFEGTEDCLVANIFTPAPENTNQLPVMVWIKGKEFDKKYEPELSFKNFVENDVVVVTLNFRESILGYLCLGTETAPGNAGLKDIVVGLHWVKENIAQFGGNPDDITLFGHGSGAAAVDLISLSQTAENLVQRIISQSGTALAPWAVSRDNLKYAIEVANALGHTVTDIESLSNIFTRTSISALMAVINDLQLTDNSLAFGPCLEKESLEGVQPFLTKSPYEILTAGEFAQIPFMTGFVENEGTIREEEALEHGWLEKMDESFEDFLQTDLRFSTQEEETQIATSIRTRYFGTDSINLEKHNNYLTYHGDTLILVSAIREARLRAMTSSAPIYLYQFSYKGSTNDVDGTIDIDMAGHREELPYLFSDIPESSSLDYLVSLMMIQRWTNFAKTGIPTSTSSSTLWQPFTATAENYLRVFDDSEIVNDENGIPQIDIALQKPHPNTLSFWDGLYEEHFRDASSKFFINGREDDDIDIIDTSDQGEDTGDNGADESEDNDEENEGDDENEGEGEEDDGNGSSSVTIGYTVLLVSLLAVITQR